MKVTPIVNADYIYRYRLLGNKVLDTFTNTEYAQTSMQKANELLNKLNTIGKQNAQIIDMGKGKGELLSIVA